MGDRAAGSQGGVLGNAAAALEALSRAVELGFSDAEDAAKETAFESLCGDARFEQLLAGAGPVAPPDVALGS